MVLVAACSSVPVVQDPVEAPGPGQVAESVVVLHGLGRSRRSMGSMARALGRAGYRVVNLGYPSRSADLPELVEHLAAQLAEAGLGPADPIARPVHFVGHSAGGILARAFLAEHPDYPVGRLVQLAPPNAGSSLATELRELPYFASVVGPLAVTLADPLEAPPHYPIGVIAGDHSILPTSLWTRGEDDGIVSVAETRFDGMADHLVVPHTHTFLMNSRTVQSQVVGFLGEGRFQR